MKQPDISVVMCTYNRAGMLRNALASLIGLETNGKFTFEIIVVDDASTDITSAVVSELRAGSPVPVRYIRAEGRGVARARNSGIAAASGEWIAFFDDDQLAAPDWLESLRAFAERTGAPCVGGAVRLAIPDEVRRALPAVCRGLLGETTGRDKPSRCDPRNTLGTGNLMLHRSVFNTVGVFDETLVTGGSDLDLFRRILSKGIAAWYTPDAAIYHMIPPSRLTEEYMAWKSKVYGKNFATRDYREKGALRNALLCLARVGQAVLIHAPGYAWARLVDNGPEALGRKCLLLRSGAYARETVSHYLPARFGRNGLSSVLEFRKERTAFSGKESSR
ncbi:MAG: glycosyltransferase family 2 protein [Candidatus Latescibacterota bacterium]